MDTLFLYNTKTLIEKFKTKVFAGDNHITKINVQIPDNIGGYPKRECEFNLRAIIPEGNMSYGINPSEPYFYITNDITEKAQTVKLMMIITHAGNVIGRTNTVDLQVREPAEAPDPPLTPRSEFDTVIAEQRETISTQEQTISSQSAEITEKTAQITTLNGEVTELEGTVAEQQATIIRQNTTIEQLNSRVPRMYTPSVVIPSSSVQQVLPPTGYDGLSECTVDRITAEVDSDIQPENIKEGVEILGVDGTYKPLGGEGGICINEVDEDGYPVDITVKNWDFKSQRDFSDVNFNGQVPNDDKFIIPFYSSILTSHLKKLKLGNCKNMAFAGFMYGVIEEVEIQSDNFALLQNAFYMCNSLKTVKINCSFIGRTFENCQNVNALFLGNGIITITNNAFTFGINNINVIDELRLPNTVKKIGASIFDIRNFRKFYIPNSIEICGGKPFADSYAGVLNEVEIENGFNCNGLILSSNRFSPPAEQIISWLEALADRTGETAYTLTIGSTNINKLTSEQIAIATNKNWNLA